MPGAASTAALAGTLALLACNSDGAPTAMGKGNDFIGLDAVAQGGDDAGDQAADGAYGHVFFGELPDGYGPLVMCAQCACDANAYCFGGASDSSFSGTCPQATSPTLSAGCNPVPSMCDAGPDCLCLLMALHDTPCTPACTQAPNGAPTVFCPP